jgi:hypothetical protein
MSLANVEEVGRGDFAMAACGELLDEFSCHVWVAKDGDAWEIHVPL